MADTPMTVEEYLKAQTAEYGTYVATQPIDIGGVRAFNPGDPVPVSHLERGVVSQDVVARANTKAAQAAVENPEGK